MLNVDLVGLKATENVAIVIMVGAAMVQLLAARPPEDQTVMAEIDMAVLQTLNQNQQKRQLLLPSLHCLHQ